MSDRERLSELFGPEEPPEPTGHREVFRIPDSGREDSQEELHLRGHLIKARYDNEGREWVVEVLTHDDATLREMANWPVRKQACRVVAEIFGKGGPSVYCEAVMCSSCRLVKSEYVGGGIFYYCYCFEK